MARAMSRDEVEAAMAGFRAGLGVARTVGGWGGDKTVADAIDDVEAAGEIMQRLVDAEVEVKLAEAIAEAVEAERARWRSRRYCGCAWCCSHTSPEDRGEAHKTCSAP